ncbi:MAG: energy transducer TonB [Ignavibacteriaceae bacterium]
MNNRKFSLIVSIIFHAIIILLISFSFNPSQKLEQKKYIEIGFGGTTESNSPGSPGGGIIEEQKVIKEKHESKKKELIKKKKAIFKEVKSNSSPVVADIGKGIANTGGRSGSEASNGKPGNGGTGNGANGSGPPKAGKIVSQDIYYVAVDQMPVPIGGMSIINARVVYPPAAAANNVHGTVYVEAFIDELGIVRKISLLKGLGFGCDQAAINAVKWTKFEAGQKNGVPVKVRMTIPVHF